MANAGKYLGLPTQWGRSKKEALRYVKDRVISKLHSWNNLFLNAAGREMLIKAVVTVIPTYAMTLFKLPKTWCQEIAALTARFWWGSKGIERRLHWRKWDRMARPKEEEAWALETSKPSTEPC